MITDHYLASYASLFVLTLALGFWLGCRFTVGRINTRRKEWKSQYEKLICEAIEEES